MAAITQPIISAMHKNAKWRELLAKNSNLRAKIFGGKPLSEDEVKQFTEDMYHCTTCGVCGTVCGAGGGVKARIPDLALDMAKARVEDVECTGAQIVASTCSFCRRNLMDGRNAAESKVKVVDVVELVAQAMGLDMAILENPYSKYQEQDVITCSAPVADKVGVKKAIAAIAK